jgi:hypothetical protein
MRQGNLIAIVSMDGWIRLYRNITEDKWYFAEKFTRQQAWLDLLILAAYKPRTIFVRGIEVNIGVGQVAMSINEMQKRWKWSRNKVLRFMTELQSEHKVELQKSNVINVISVRYVDVYHDNGTANETTECTNSKERNGKKESTKENKGKKENIIKEKKETPTIVGVKKETKVSDAAEAATLSKVKGIEEKQRDFYETMRPYVGKYPKEMLRAFYDYWSEPNRSRTKMRVELEKTWSLPLRLATWNKRDKERQFNGNNSRDNTAKQRADDAAGIVARLLSQNKPAGQ